MRNPLAAERVVCAAREWIGTPYQHQASLQRIGSDCLGLVRGIWREVEGREPQTVPAYSSAWAETGGTEQLIQAGLNHFVSVQTGAAKPGDILVFRMRQNTIAKHVGVLSSVDRFIHAYESNCVTESALSSFWQRRIAAAFRFPSVVRKEQA